MRGVISGWKKIRLYRAPATKRNSDRGIPDIQKMRANKLKIDYWLRAGKRHFNFECDLTGLGGGEKSGPRGLRPELRERKEESRTSDTVARLTRPHPHNDI